MTDSRYEIRIKPFPKGLGVTIRGEYDEAPTSFIRHVDGLWTSKTPPASTQRVTDPDLILILDDLALGYMRLTGRQQ